VQDFSTDFWLILIKLYITTTKNATENLNNQAIKLTTYAQTKTNETKGWFRGQGMDWGYSTAAGPTKGNKRQKAN